MPSKVSMVDADSGVTPYGNFLKSKSAYSLPSMTIEVPRSLTSDV